MKRINQTQFIDAMRYGQFDFSDYEFIDHIRVDGSDEVNFNNLPRLIFDRASLGPDFSLGRWSKTAASVSMEGATSEGRVAILHMNLHLINLSGIRVKRWLAVMHCEVEVLNISGAQLPGGFITKGSHGGRLDLTGCKSNQSLFDRTSWRNVEIDDAVLGKLVPTTLGELRSH